MQGSLIMANHRTTAWKTVIRFLAAVLVLKVTAEVVLGFRNYFPPDFRSDFLRGREDHFFGVYRWAFYPHIVAGPITLVFGLLLVSDRIRLRFPRAHRVMGRAQVALALLVVAPSGFVMARETATGPVAGASFATLSLVTAATMAIGWRKAVVRQFADHRRWMLRGFLLLCSAVALRLLAGLATVLEVQSSWFDPIASWVSWIAPLAVFEVFRGIGRRRPRAGLITSSNDEATELSPPSVERPAPQRDGQVSRFPKS